jgi:hypothetical protein
VVGSKSKPLSLHNYLPVAVLNQSFLLKYCILHHQYYTINNENILAYILSCMKTNLSLQKFERLGTG